MSVKIIIDSAADLGLDYIDKVIKVPMTLTFGTDEYKDGITIDKDEFYRKLEKCDILPKTSQIPPLDFDNILMEKVAQEGIDFTRPVLLGYSGLSDALLQEYVENSRQLWEGQINKPDQTQLGSIIGTHAGPGAVAVAFFIK